MDETPNEAPESADGTTYEAPRLTVLSLDCEISAYAPDDGGEQPLF